MKSKILSFMSFLAAPFILAGCGKKYEVCLSNAAPEYSPAFGRSCKPNDDGSCYPGYTKVESVDPPQNGSCTYAMPL
jgi:hypothetical protein